MINLLFLILCPQHDQEFFPLTRFVGEIIALPPSQQLAALQNIYHATDAGADPDYKFIFPLVIEEDNKRHLTPHPRFPIFFIYVPPIFL